MRLRLTLVASAASALVLAAVATAHVEISPKKVNADSVARLVIEVPTERKAPTLKLEVKLPRGVGDVQPETKPGWTSTNRGGVLTWSGGEIAPGHSGKFVFSAQMPDTPGKELVFPAIQTYADGVVEHWIGAPDSDTPAPRVMLEGTATATLATATVNDRSDDHRDLARGIGIALVAGLLAFGLVFFRKRRA